MTGSWPVDTCRSGRSLPSTRIAAMREIRAVEPLEGRCVRLTLSDGTVVERDLSDLL